MRRCARHHPRAGAELLAQHVQRAGARHLRRNVLQAARSSPGVRAPAVSLSLPRLLGCDCGHRRAQPAPVRQTADYRSRDRVRHEQPPRCRERPAADRAQHWLHHVRAAVAALGEKTMRYKILSVFAALIGITACGDLTSINTNPNGPVDVPPPSILPSVIQTLAGTVNGVTSLNIRGGGLWVQYYSEIQYRDEDKFILRSGTSGGWGFYNGALEDAQRMINKGAASSAPNWSAVGRIMKSYIYSVMTDAMGDLPYSQALKGDTVLHPAYDTQQAIYNGMLADLAQANTEIDFGAAAVGFPSGDLMYGGKMASWKKFANSLRLRLAIHLSNVDPTKAAS